MNLSFHCRPLTTETDWWRVRDLLIETISRPGPRLNWEPREWEGNRYYSLPVEWNPDEYADHILWETAAGQLAGVVHHERDWLLLQVHPDFRAAIEEPMLAYGEAHFAQTSTGERKHIQVMAYEWDALRWHMLEKRGYEKMTYGWITRWLRIRSQPLPEPVVPGGYTLRATFPPSAGEVHWADCQRMADLLNAAFNRPGVRQAGDIHAFMAYAPMYLNQLNLVMVAPDGSFAAQAGLNYVSAARYGVFEPVSTHPDHRQRGLAKALMYEAIRRACDIGALTIEVSTGDAQAANALYDSIGFTEYYKAYAWKKVW